MTAGQVADQVRAVLAELDRLDAEVAKLPEDGRRTRLEAQSRLIRQLGEDMLADAVDEARAQARPPG